MARWEDEALDFWKQEYPKSWEEHKHPGQGTMADFGKFMLAAYIDNKVIWEGGFYNPNHLRSRGEANPISIKIENHVDGKYYVVSCEQRNLQGRSTYYLGEKVVDKYLD